MLRLVLFLVACVLYSFSYAQPTPGKAKEDKLKSPVLFVQKDTVAWIENFRQFRDAVFRQDKKKLSVFIGLPMRTEENEIWDWVYSSSESPTGENIDRLKAFTQKDFDKYYKRLFHPLFIKSLLKVKTEQLYNKSSFDGEPIINGKDRYQLFASFNSTESMLELNWATVTTIVVQGETEDAEFNVNYQFKVSPKGHLKLVSVRLAG